MASRSVPGVGALCLLLLWLASGMGVGVGQEFGVVTAHAEEDEGHSSLAERYRPVAQLEVPVEEISGWSPLPGQAGDADRKFLAVSDEGRYHPADRTVRGALFLVSFCVGAAEAAAVTFASSHAITLRLGKLVPRIDPAWARGHSPLDLEACVPLPGAEDLYLLSGERNPEDITDSGANRLYVVRYPGSAEGETRSFEHADLLGYMRLPDLRDDAINDRFEAVIATRTTEANTWQVYAFKERTESEGQPPVYFPLVLRRDGDAFTMSSPHLEQYLPSLPAVLPSKERLGSQADACLGPDGNVWILDRWRREVHIAKAPPLPSLELRFEETIDVYQLIAEVPGETGSLEPAAPGSRRAGYGRHEAMTFDAHGWLWLAADLGGGRKSVVTVLARRTADEEGGEEGNEEGGD